MRHKQDTPKLVVIVSNKKTECEENIVHPKPTHFPLHNILEKMKDPVRKSNNHKKNKKIVTAVLHSAHVTTVIVDTKWYKAS